MKVAVVGTGRVARTIGGGLAAAGHEVVFGSRAPGGSDLPGPDMDLLSAVESAEIVVDAIPGGVALDVFDSIGAEALAGKILIDVANAIGEGFALLYPNSSLGAQLQERFPDTRVVKTSNTVQVGLMNNPTSLPAATTVFLAGNDAEAKAVVAGLLGDLGWPADWHFDLGDITQARATEHYIFLSFGIAQALDSTEVNIAVVR